MAPLQFSSGHKEDEIKTASPEIATERGLSEENSGGEKEAATLTCNPATPFFPASDSSRSVN